MLRFERGGKQVGPALAIENGSEQRSRVVGRCRAGENLSGRFDGRRRVEPRKAPRRGHPHADRIVRPHEFPQRSLAGGVADCHQAIDRGFLQVGCGRLVEGQVGEGRGDRFVFPGGRKSNGRGLQRGVPLRFLAAHQLADGREVACGFLLAGFGRVDEPAQRLQPQFGLEPHRVDRPVEHDPQVATVPAIADHLDDGPLPFGRQFATLKQFEQGSNRALLGRRDTTSQADQETHQRTKRHSAHHDHPRLHPVLTDVFHSDLRFASVVPCTATEELPKHARLWHRPLTGSARQN